MTAATVGLAHLLVLSAGALFVVACSPGPAPIATSPHDPSNPSAPEGVSPLSAASPPPEAPAGEPAHHHEHASGAPNAAGAAGAGGAPSAGPASALYVCPMHPAVTASAPGQCPQCGMNLVPKK